MSIPLNGKKTEYDYDEFGRKKGIWFSAPNDSRRLVKSFEYKYDGSDAKLIGDSSFNYIIE